MSAFPRHVRRAAWSGLATALLAVAPPARAQRVMVAERIEVLEARAKADSNDAAAHYNLAMGYWSRKRLAEAEAELRRCVAIEPSFAEAFLALAVVRWRDDAYWSAIYRNGKEAAVRDSVALRNGYYSKAFLLDPFVDVRILGGASRSWGGGRVLSAIDQLSEGRYDQAFQGFDQELADGLRREGFDSIGGGLLWYHAMAAARSGHDSAALIDYTELLKRAERDVTSDSVRRQAPLAANEYRYAMAALQLRDGHAPEAIAGFRDVLEHDVGNFMAHVQLARAFESAKDWPNAIVERRRALETSPEDAWLGLDLGITLGRAGQFAEAADVLQRAAAVNPRDTRTLYWLGLAYLQLGRRDDARTALDRFVTLAPARYERQIATARQRLAELP